MQQKIEGLEQTFYSHGKLLLTGEYLVLDGATALAIPTKKGQSLHIAENDEPVLQWNSKDEQGNTWFHAKFNQHLKTMETSNAEMAKTLVTILQEAKRLNSNFLTLEKGCLITTTLEFPRNWGLGSSSTLINNIAQWAQVDAYTLLENSFGGSGYDVAAAQAQGPIFYTKQKTTPRIKQVALSWDFQEALFFVYLNKKQDSKLGIAHYKAQIVSDQELQRVTDITKKLLLCYSLQDFERLMEHHEQLISNILQLPTVKERLFSDYTGVVKSLGAWGGDFVLATGGERQQNYFRNKGYQTIVPFTEMMA